MCITYRVTAWHSPPDLMLPQIGNLTPHRSSHSVGAPLRFCAETNKWRIENPVGGASSCPSSDLRLSISPSPPAGPWATWSLPWVLELHSLSSCLNSPRRPAQLVGKYSFICPCYLPSTTRVTKQVLRQHRQGDCPAHWGSKMMVTADTECLLYSQPWVKIFIWWFHFNNNLMRYI